MDEPIDPNKAAHYLKKLIELQNGKDKD